MSRKTLFLCAECGGDVFSTTGPGRTAAYRRGVDLPVPEDFAVPKCAECGETYLTASESERLATLQKPAFEAWLTNHATALIDALRKRHRISQKQLEIACGLTPTYFSHISRGRKTPSLQLVRLLEAFEAVPDELQRHIEGRAWKPADVAASIFTTPVMQGAAASIESGRAVITACAPATYKAMQFTLGPASNDNRTAA